MRMMLRWTVPVEKGNHAIKDGTLPATLDAMQAALNPEAAYFWAEQGKRAGMMVFDMREPAQIPQIAEPLFTKLDAAVELVPVMNAADLKKALDALSRDSKA